MGLSPDVTQDLQAEQTLLGTLIQFPSTIPDAAKRISPKDFFHPKNQYLFEAVTGLFGEGNPVSPTSVLAELDRRQLLGKAGGAPYLTDLIQVPTTAGDAGYYAGLVFDRARIRRIHDLGARLSHATELDADACVNAVHKFLQEAQVDRESDSNDFDAAYESWTEWYDTEAKAIPTPWPGLNSILYGGWHRGRLYTVIGRPGAGKSALCLGALSQAAKAGYRSVVYSMEMGREECMSRILASATGIPLKNLFTHRLTAEDRSRIEQFATNNTRPHMKINDNPSQTIESIMADCRAMKSKGLDMVAIDHSLLLAPSDKRWALHQQVAHVAKQAKLLSRQLDIAVVLLHQMNREKDRENRKPRLSDMREGGEQDADVILALTREDGPRQGEIDLHLLKNRMGRANCVTTLMDELKYGRLG